MIEPYTFRVGRVPVTVETGPLETPCHVWQGCVNSKGYPVRTVNGERVLAHRLALESRIGVLPEGTQAHHRCETRRCINSEHLDPVSATRHNRSHVDGGAIGDRMDAVMADGQWRRPASVRQQMTWADRESIARALQRAARRGEYETDGTGWYRKIDASVSPRPHSPRTAPKTGTA